MPNILNLPELRERLLNFLIFEFDNKLQKHRVNKSEVKTWRLVSKACLQTVHQCLRQEIRNPARNRDYTERELLLFTVPISESCVKTGRSVNDLLALMSNPNRVQPKLMLPFGIYLNMGVNLSQISKQFVDILTICESGLVEIDIYFQQSATLGIALPLPLFLTNLRYIAVHYTVSRKFRGNKTVCTNDNSGAQMIQALLDAASANLGVFKIWPSNSPCSLETLHFPTSMSSIHMNGRMGMREMVSVLLGSNNNLRNLRELSLTTNSLMSERMECGQVFKILLLCRRSLELLELNGWGNNHMFQIPPVMDKLRELNVGSSWTLEEKPSSYRSNLPELKRLDLRRNSEIDVSTWTTRYPADSLASLKVRLRGQVETEVFRDVSLTRKQLDSFHFAYPNITHLDIQLCQGPSNEDTLEQIFREMVNLVQLHIFVKTGIRFDWDAALLGASAKNIKSLRQQKLPWNDLLRVDLVDENPSIRDLKHLQNLKIEGGYSATGSLFELAVIAEHHFLSDLSIRFGLLKMEKLNCVNISKVPIRISAKGKEKMRSRFGKSVKIGENYRRYY